MADKFLVFDIWACYGHFKKPYTTTSPITYSIPSRTALAGMISAIIGIDKREYLKYFGREQARIALGIRNPVQKVRISENFINTKESVIRIKNRTQIKVEYLKNPCYRIYFSHREREIYNKLRENLANHSSFYTVTMGLSENLANFKFVGEYDAEEIKSSEEVELKSVVLLDSLKQGDINFQTDGEYFTETIPLEMDENRQVTLYGEILFERNCKPISGKIDKHIYIQGLEERISLL